MIARRAGAGPWLAALSLLVILAAIYGPGIGRGFIKDDVVWVGANQVTSWQDVRALIFRTDGFYRPLVGASFAADRALYGLHPLGFGITNLLLLVLGAAALAYLGRSLGLNPTIALVMAGVWALNVHAVNMAVLWLSGRTALCVAACALLSAVAFTKRMPLAAGVAALLAMFSKEEAVMLPIILGAWAWVGARDAGTFGARLREVIRLTWPSWVALAIYLALRSQTGAMTPSTSPWYYTLAFTPGRLVGNLFEYLDRACTFSAIVLVVAHLVALRRPSFTPAVRRMTVLGAIWFAGAYSLTVFLPIRSSLYALLPSIGPALVTGVLLQELWNAATPPAHRRLVIAAVVLPLALLPLYWARNTRWIEIADLSSDTFTVVQCVTQSRPDLTSLVFRDDEGTRRNFANTYGNLLPDAVRLATGRSIPSRLETEGPPSGEHEALIVLSQGSVRSF